MAAAVDMFSINIDSGWICIAKDLDFELQEVYDFPVIARDAGKFSFKSSSHLNLHLYSLFQISDHKFSLIKCN